MTYATGTGLGCLMIFWYIIDQILNARRTPPQTQLQNLNPPPSWGVVV